MNTAGGNDEPYVSGGWVHPSDEEHRLTEEEAKELAARWEGARDPSVRDVLAQLDRIETQVGVLNEQVGALNARMDELTKPVIYVGQTPPDTEAETQ